MMDDDREQSQELLPFYSFSPSGYNESASNHQTLESFQTPIESLSRNRRLNHGLVDTSPLIPLETNNHESLEEGLVTPRSR